MKIAVVHNRYGAPLCRFGTPTKEMYAEKQVIGVRDILREAGYEVEILEGDISLFARLSEFMPVCEKSSKPTGMVFNMSYGLQGEQRYTHVPAMLEMAGIPYTGSSPLGHALALDKVVAKRLFVEAGLPTPAYRVMDSIMDWGKPLKFPLVVKPKHESTSYGLSLVRDLMELDLAVADIRSRFLQTALVEEFIEGREFCVGILGNGPSAITLPVCELEFGNRVLKMNTFDDKYRCSGNEPTKVCPANIDETLTDRLSKLAISVFRTCHLRDYARVDFRVSQDGKPYILEVNSMASLGHNGSYEASARAMGLTPDQLILQIVKVARQRIEFSEQTLEV